MLLCITFAALLPGCLGAGADYREEPPDPEWLHESVRALTDVMVHDIFSPPLASRAYAYSSVAAYEALRHGYPGYRSLAGQLNELSSVPAPDADREIFFPAASTHAFLTVATQLVFSQERMRAFHDEMLEHFRRGLPRPVLEASLRYGEEVAEHIMAWSRQDHYLETRGYPRFTVVEEPGRWVPTPPGYLDAVEPNWHEIRPMVMDSSSQLRPKPPLSYDMTEGSPFYKQAWEVYQTGIELTDEQEAISAFWNDNPFSLTIQGHAMFGRKLMTPGGHWMGIAAIAARSAEADLVQAAESYALTAVALFDGFMSCWDEKFRSTLVRPETVIQRHFDEAWEPLLQTPPFPEYTSGHSVISRSAAEVLTMLYGENFAFEDTTLHAFGLPSRQFGSFLDASEEAAMSRLYGGIHYPMAIEEGVRQGEQVGHHVIDRITTREPSLSGGE